MRDIYKKLQPTNGDFKKSKYDKLMHAYFKRLRHFNSGVNK